jgi:hypothetical protein
MKSYFTCFLIFTSLLFSSCVAKPVDKEAQFWKWFVENKTNLYTQKEEQEKLLDELANHLHKVDSNLTFEFSPIDNKGIREFTISADGLYESFPAVISLVKKAPKIDKWKFVAFRQRIPDESLAINFGNNIKIGYKDIYFRYKIDSGKILIELNIRNYVDAPNFKSAIFVLLDALLGEYDAVTQIGYIEFVLLDEDKIGTMAPIIDLKKLVDKNKQVAK